MKLVILRVIASFQIVGGVLILIANHFGLAQQGLPDTLLYLLLYLLTSIGTTSLAVVAGLMLWRQSRLGVRLSMIVQILQLTWISIPRAQFGAIIGPLAGFQLLIDRSGDVYNTLSVGFYGKGGLFLLPANSPVQFPLSISVNLLAVLALGFLGYLLNSRDAVIRRAT